MARKKQQPTTEIDAAIVAKPATEKESPQDQQEDSALVEQMQDWYDAQMKHYKDNHVEIKKNRRYFKGYSKDDKKSRANLIHSTQQGLLPFIYAKDPQISIRPSEAVEADRMQAIRGLAKTLRIIVQRELTDAGLKKKAKSAVRSVFATSFGHIKITYQRDIFTDPVMKDRINDAQDNIQRLDDLIEDVKDDDNSLQELNADKERLELLVKELGEKAEVVVERGLTIDRVRTDDLIIDSCIEETDDYLRAPRIAQRIFMTKDECERRFGTEENSVNFEGAKIYRKRTDTEGQGGVIDSKGEGKELVLVLEIWDHGLNTVLTMLDGGKNWLREPFSPERTGKRWYPFFALYFWPLDGEFWPQNLVDLIVNLQEDYNEANAERSLARKRSKPHWIADSGSTKREDIQAVQHAVLGEIVMFDTGGRPVRDVLDQSPPLNINAEMYDTTYIRGDIDMITGQQDAWRGAVMKAKTLGEAQIMQAGNGGRMGELQDQIEDWLDDIAQYAAEILLQELGPEEAQAIAGPGATWPSLDKEEVFDLVQVSILAGTTGRPDKAREQQVWSELLPVIQELILKIVELREQHDQAVAQASQNGQMATNIPDMSKPFIGLLKETIRRFDESLPIDEFLPDENQGLSTNVLAALGQLAQYFGVPMPGAQTQPDIHTG